MSPAYRGGVDRWIDDLVRSYSTASAGTGFPPLNARDEGTHFEVEAELPGFSKKDIDISLVGNELRITGSRQEETESDAKYHLRERYRGSFERVVRFPVDIEDGGVDAKFDNGVLTITLPKAKTALPKKIAVKD
jgi:HSP20 family protein